MIRNYLSLNCSKKSILVRHWVKKLLKIYHFPFNSFQPNVVFRIETRNQIEIK